MPKGPMGNKDIEGEWYYKDLHLLRANGYAPATDISMAHKDIEDSLRMREGTWWGQGLELAN